MIMAARQHQGSPAAARQLHLHMHIDTNTASGDGPALHPALLHALLGAPAAAAAESHKKHSVPVLGSYNDRMYTSEASTSAATAAAGQHGSADVHVHGKHKRRRRRWVKVLIWTGTVSMAAGAGIAVFLMRPKLQELESSCDQVRARVPETKHCSPRGCVGVVF